MYDYIIYVLYIHSRSTFQGHWLIRDQINQCYHQCFCTFECIQSKKSLYLSYITIILYILDYPVRHTGYFQLQLILKWGQQVHSPSGHVATTYAKAELHHREFKAKSLISFMVGLRRTNTVIWGGNTSFLQALFLSPSLHPPPSLSLSLSLSLGFAHHFHVILPHRVYKSFNRGPSESDQSARAPHPPLTFLPWMDQSKAVRQ